MNNLINIFFKVKAKILSHNIRVEGRIIIILSCLFLVAILLIFSHFSILTKFLLFIIYCLFGLIFSLKGIKLLNVYFLFFILTNLYLTLRYFIIKVNEIILDWILFYFIIILFIIFLFAIPKRYFKFGIIQKLSLYTVSVYKRRLVIFFILYLCLYYFVVARNLHSFNILIILAHSLVIRENLSSAGSFYFSLILAFLSNLVFLIALIIDYLNADRTKYRIWFLIIIILLSLPLGSRGTIVFDILEYLILNYLVFKKFSLIKITLIGIAGIVFIGWYGKIRNGGETTSSSMNMLRFVFSRFDAIDNYISIYPYINGQRSYGSSFSSIILQPVPRSIYRDKPLLFNTFLTQRYYPQAYSDNVTFDFSVFPEALYNFGQIGLILLGIYLGIVFKFINDFFSRAYQSNDPCFCAIIYSQLYLYPIFVLISGWIDSGTTIAIVSGLINLFFTILLINGR